MQVLELATGLEPGDQILRRGDVDGVELGDMHMLGHRRRHIERGRLPDAMDPLGMPQHVIRGRVSDPRGGLDVLLADRAIGPGRMHAGEFHPEISRQPANQRLGEHLADCGGDRSGCFSHGGGGRTPPVRRFGKRSRSDQILSFGLGLGFGLGLAVVDLDDRSADVHRVADRNEQSAHRTGDGTGQLHQRLGGLDLDEDVVDPHLIALGDQPLSDLRLGQAFAGIGQLELEHLIVLISNPWIDRRQPARDRDSAASRPPACWADTACRSRSRAVPGIP